MPCHTHLVRPRSPVAAVTVAITVLTGAAILVGCGSDDDGGDTQRFCAEVAANVAAIVTPPLATEDDVDDDARPLPRPGGHGADRDRRGDGATCCCNVETASTVVPEDPESVQRTVAVAFATERSAVAVQNWVLTNCGVDLGPVATIAPQDPAATTTLAPDVSTSLVTVEPPPTARRRRPRPSSPRCRRRHCQRRCHRPTCHRRPVPPDDQSPVDQMDLAAAQDDLVDEAVVLGALGGEPAVALAVGLDLLERLARVHRDQLGHALLGVAQLLGLDGDVGGLATQTRPAAGAS